MGKLASASNKCKKITSLSNYFAAAAKLWSGSKAGLKPQYHDERCDLVAVPSLTTPSVRVRVRVRVLVLGFG